MNRSNSDSIIINNDLIGRNSYFTDRLRSSAIKFINHYNDLKLNLIQYKQTMKNKSSEHHLRSGELVHDLF